MDSDTCYGVRLATDGAGDPDGGDNISFIVVVFHPGLYRRLSID